VSDWLRWLDASFGEYATAFAQNEIDGSLLPEMAAQLNLLDVAPADAARINAAIAAAQTADSSRTAVPAVVAVPTTGVVGAFSGVGVGVPPFAAGVPSFLPNGPMHAAAVPPVNTTLSPSPTPEEMAMAAEIANVQALLAQCQ
jgi:hypothetical protein